MENKLITAAIEVDGKWYKKNSQEFKLEVFTKIKDIQSVMAKFTNSSDRTIRFGGFRFDLAAWDNVPGTRIRIYREGWTMASASASVRYGECDFEADPHYLKYAVTNPDEYSSDLPNRFSAEHVAVLNDRETGDCILAGFVTSADQLTRLTIELKETGVSRFSAFSSGDGIKVDPGETVESEELIIYEGCDGYSMLQQFADIWGQRMNALSWSHVPTGWCSWYYYFSGITEKDMLENLEFLKAHRDEYPVEYIQLDDGYQVALGDWLICNEKFPNGLKSLAENIRKAGFKPALWLAPFMVEERSRLFTEHPDWMVHDADGDIIRVTTWRGCPVAALDGTHPGAQEYLRHIFSTLIEWGFEYVKLDFMVYACCGTGGAYHDRKATRAQALRRGLTVIREAMEDKFILGCTTPL
ncbi:MAG: alpha-galactosidase, partial [Victivallales bacterium]|nr:alpha-galactosidase [Victivallales bacterium]